MLAPATEHFVLVHRDKNDQRITLDPAIPHDPLHAVDDRFDGGGARIALGQQIDKQRALGQAGANI
ncbi:hypothetical protein D3C87_1700150 [compost metagenome]